MLLLVDWKYPKISKSKSLSIAKSALDVDIHDEIVKVNRCDRQGKPPLLFVRLKDVVHRNMILKNAYKLKSSKEDRLKRIYINPDLTKIQIRENEAASNGAKSSTC